MQYIVNAVGDIYERKSKAYAVKASSKEEAELIAKKFFEEDFPVIDNNINVKPMRRTEKAIASYVLMLVPILLSFVEWKIGHKTITMYPHYISCLYSVLLYVAFVVRFKGIQRTLESWIDIGFTIMCVILLSTFIETILVTKSVNLLWMKEISIDTSVVLPIAVILSWLGLKVLSVVCMGMICLCAIFNISLLSSAMGPIKGSIYVICAFLGILFYLSVEPVAVEMMNGVRKTAQLSSSYVKRDFSQAKDSIQKLNKTVQSNDNIDSKDKSEVKIGVDK